MIARALDFVTKQLGDFLNRKSPGRKSPLKLSGLVTPEGGTFVAEDNTLVLSVVNIAEEGSIANQPNIKRHGNVLLKQPPPLYLNVYILISALFKEDQYAKGLHQLSLAVNFFQQQSRFTSELTEMPKGISRLTFELVNLDIDNMSRFWGALGARYQPSVIYKMRMLTISSETMEAILPELKETEVKSGFL